MTKDEVLQMALDLAIMHHSDDGYSPLRARVQFAIKETLAQPEQEPMTDKWRKLALQFDAHRMMALSHLRAMLQDPEKHADVAREFLGATPPQPKEPEQEPVAVVDLRNANYVRWIEGVAYPVEGTKLYAEAPQRKPLT